MTYKYYNCHANATLLGRNWLANMKIEWSRVFSVVKETLESSLDKIIREHSNLFSDEYRGIKGHIAHIRIQDDATPKYHKPRTVPYAMKTMVEEELDRLESQGIISKISETEWASPVVVVPKSDGTVRLCGDYKVSINPVVDDEQYPLPTAQDLFAALAGSKVFSKLDLSHAYSQVSVDEKSKKYLSINTHRGLYAYNKLPYGVKSASKIFQAVMDKILQGIPNVLCFQDDVLVGGTSEEEHLQLLKQVLDRLSAHEIQLKREKCKFMQQEVTFLGHKINADGALPLQEKVNAISQASKPNDVSELRSFLGMMQYYARFMPNLATTLAPLYDLLKKDVMWKWTETEQSAFDLCKKSLTSDTLLVHYDVKRELRLACDASNYGVGAVLSHVMDDGQERPVAYASRTLTKSEKNYSQIEKEALAIIFGVKKFHQYIYGRRFQLVTDHQPLVAIFGPTSPVPTLAAARMQRWALILSAHDYEIKYRRSADHANADALSRLPLKFQEKEETSATVYKVSAVNELPVSSRDIAMATRKDPVLSRVHQYTLSGWPTFTEVPEELRPYYNRRNELSSEQGCLLWGFRVVIPVRLREKILAELHFEHPGMCSMKAIARSFVWWPKLDASIEELVKQCNVCQRARGDTPKVPLLQWSWPTRPFQRVHVDFCEKDGNYFLVLIDSHSKWIEVKHMTSTTAQRTVDELRLIFADHGLPEEIVSDNGPQLTSSEFEIFLKNNGIKHTLVPPYHPASNGAAERSVRTVKDAFVKQVLEGVKGVSMKHRLANFLLRYRTTPHSVTGRTPAELMLGRQLRTRLSLVRPDTAKHVQDMQLRQKQQFDRHKKERFFAVQDKVFVRSTQRGLKPTPEHWIPGTVTKVCGPRGYLVRTRYSTRYVHVDHLKSRHDSEDVVPAIQIDDDLPVVESSTSTVAESESSTTSLDIGEQPSTLGAEKPAARAMVVPRRSTRVRKPVQRLDL